MKGFSKESLEQLRNRIDLVEVISPYVSLQRAGAYYKGLCPFHEEKTPSFVIAKGDTHYHCYGCKAHGDAIQFLISHMGVSFAEAVQILAEKFGVILEEERGEKPGWNKAYFRKPLEEALQFYHYCLLHTIEGQKNLKYLYLRGIDLTFIQNFCLGYAPKGFLLQRYLLSQGYSKELLLQVGLLKQLGEGKIGDFFSERIMIPILDSLGNAIGFSARKVEETSFGPKYINSPETPLFKKSKILFGLNYSRKNIAKYRKALLVEGQLDALRLIQEGFAFTVASQGTAFSEDHAKELIQLGLDEVYIAFDPDEAGQKATDRLGDLFQKEGIEVKVVSLPMGYDPDLVLREKGPEAMQALIQKSQDFLSFLVHQETKRLDLQSPAQKTELVQSLANRIRRWDHPLMVHESLKKLARLTQTPESMIGIETKRGEYFVKQEAHLSFPSIDPDRILEGDLLRWLVLLGEEKPHLIEIAKQNLSFHHFKVGVCVKLYKKYLQLYEEKRPLDILSLTMEASDSEVQLFLSELLQKKVNPSRVEEVYIETVQKILDRHWMEQREHIKVKIFSGKCSEAEIMELAHQFDELKKNRPQMVFPG